jgi:predicted Zn finger-like uncharacterized protein
VKFLCDRCKTRYSIGDERVRGKILKIRCKNCNNVITVREGMPEIGADEGRRKGQPTQAIEAVSKDLAGGNGALGAAFASAMTKPPPALEEEWYVSIEGDQAGPFSLAEAQRWVTAKSIDAELHCWSEGFDDWLPVDKVSHFRGLRKRPAPAPTTPPPLPRAATSGLRSVTRNAPVEEEPKPLFAATMASLEKATQPPLGSGNFNLPPLASPTAPATRGTPLTGQPSMPRANGSAAVKTPIPSLTSGRAVAKPAYPDPAESVTRIESPSFDDEARTTAEPVASAANDAFSRALRDKKSDPFANKADPFAQTTPQQTKSDPFAKKPDPFARPALDLTQQVGDQDIDGDLDIGEVSRVVKLADIVKTPPKGDRAQPAARQSGIAVASRNTAQNLQPLNRTGNLAALGRTGSAASIPLLGPDGKQIDPTTGEPIPLAPQVAVSHRRGMIALLVGALVLLGGAAAAVIYIVTSSDDSSGGGLVGYDVDTTRPDDPRRQGGTGTAPIDDKQPTNPFVPRPRPRPTQPQIPVQPTNPNAKDLRPDEVEDMAGKYSGSTQTCWRRSQRGSEAIILSDLKKLGVTLVVNKDGTVTSVTLSDHATTSLGKCLMSSIKSWKFRESTAGITARITLVFQGV